MLLGNVAAKVDPDIGRLLPQDRVERQEEDAEADVDARRGQKRAKLHLRASSVPRAETVCVI